jgi:hypothetical protein
MGRGGTKIQEELYASIIEAANYAPIHASSTPEFAPIKIPLGIPYQDYIAEKYIAREYHRVSGSGTLRSRYSGIVL